MGGDALCSSSTLHLNSCDCGTWKERRTGGSQSEEGGTELLILVDAQSDGGENSPLLPEKPVPEGRDIALSWGSPK